MKKIVLKSLVISVLTANILCADNTPMYPGHTSGEFKNNSGFAALKNDGSVITWGSQYSGGDSSSVADKLSGGFIEIFSTNNAFAALKSDGSVVTWGSEYSGGDSSSVTDKLSNGVVNIFSTNNTFAALKDDGSVITWGNSGWGTDTSKVHLNNVVKIFSNNFAFIALRNDGSAVVWGESYTGENNYPSSIGTSLSSGVIDVTATSDNFIVLKNNGTVLYWGMSANGLQNLLPGTNEWRPESGMISNVKKIFSNTKAFALLKNDGSVLTWGSTYAGGDSSSVSNALSKEVSEIYSTNDSFAALKEDGSVVTWGSADGGNSSSVADRLSTGVIKVFSSGGAFAALKEDGSVITWGDYWSGGDSSSSINKLSSGVVNIFSTNGAFAALKNDGSVVTWGNSDLGGDSSSVSDKLSQGIVKVYSNDSSFSALKENGSVVTWGSEYSGGDSSSVSDKLSSGVVCIQSIYEDCRIDSIRIISPEIRASQTAFIERFYQNIMNRTADEGGMATWLDVIQNESAAKVALGFFKSQEFINKDLSNPEFVDILYTTLFDRQADYDGRTDWLNKLNNNLATKDEVMYGFFNAQEFANLANRFGVTQIRAEDQLNTGTTGVDGYVNRFYDLVLNRTADDSGFTDWTTQLNAGTKGGGDIAKGFFNSQEYLNRGLDNSTFLDICYRAFFDREADEGGKSNWTTLLNQGASNDTVLDGFIDSQEFINLANTFGISNRL